MLSSVDLQHKHFTRIVLPSAYLSRGQLPELGLAGLELVSGVTR